MALARTLLQMRTSARQRAAMENSQFVTDPEVDEYLNYGLEQLYDKLIAARGQNYYRSIQTVTTVANQSLYALASDFYQLISGDWQVSTGGGNPLMISLRPYNEAERNRYRWYPGWYYNRPVYYQLQGNNISFIPMPAGVNTVFLNYVPAFIRLVNNGDTFDGVSGWEEWAIWSAVVDMLSKEESDVSVPMAKMAAREMRITGLAPDRDAGDAPRVQEIDDNGDGWGGWDGGGY